MPDFIEVRADDGEAVTIYSSEFEVVRQVQGTEIAKKIPSIPDGVLIITESDTYSVDIRTKEGVTIKFAFRNKLQIGWW